MRPVEAVERDYEFSGKHVQFVDGKVVLEGEFTAAELRRFADALDAEGVVESYTD